MNTAIEMHDSHLNEIKIETNGSGFVLLEAYVHRTEGTPGISAGEGGMQHVRLNFSSMEVEGKVGELPTYLYEGSLLAGDNLQDNMIPYPARFEAEIRLTMMLAEDARIVVVWGRGLTIQPEGEFEFVENVDFSWH